MEPKFNPRSHLLIVVLCYPWVGWKIWHPLRYRAPGRGAVHASKQNARCPCTVCFIVSCIGVLSPGADPPSSPVHYVFLCSPWFLYLLSVGATAHLREVFYAVPDCCICCLWVSPLARGSLLALLVPPETPEFVQNSWVIFGEAFY